MAATLSTSFCFFLFKIQFVDITPFAISEAKYYVSYAWEYNILPGLWAEQCRWADPTWGPYWVGRKPRAWPLTTQSTARPGPPKLRAAVHKDDLSLQYRLPLRRHRRRSTRWNPSYLARARRTAWDVRLPRQAQGQAHSECAFTPASLRFGFGGRDHCVRPWQPWCPRPGHQEAHTHLSTPCNPFLFFCNVLHYMRWIMDTYWLNCICISCSNSIMWNLGLLITSLVGFDCANWMIASNPCWTSTRLS